MVKPGKTTTKDIELAILRCVYKPLEVRHEIGHLAENAHVVEAIPNESLHLGIDLGGDLQLFCGQKDGCSDSHPALIADWPLADSQQCSVRS